MSYSPFAATVVIYICCLVVSMTLGNIGMEVKMLAEAEPSVDILMEAPVHFSVSCRTSDCIFLLYDPREFSKANCLPNFLEHFKQEFIITVVLGNFVTSDVITLWSVSM